MPWYLRQENRIKFCCLRTKGCVAAWDKLSSAFKCHALRTALALRSWFTALNFLHISFLPLSFLFLLPPNFKAEHFT